MDREIMEMEDPGENERFIRRVIKELPEMPAAEDTEDQVHAGQDPAETEEDHPLDLVARYSGMSDEEVVSLCRDGDTLAEEYLLDKYKNFVRSRARSYFLVGADHEDIVQEGMIGLYKAVRDYKL